MKATMKNIKVKCECCSANLEISKGKGQVIIEIECGGSIWLSPKRWEKFLKQLNKLL